MGRKKEDSGGSVFLTVILVILIIALVGTLIFTLDALGISIPLFERAGMSFSSALEENNYQAAYTIYASSENKEKELTELEVHLNGYFEKCTSEDYNSDVWTTYRGIEVFNEDIKENVLDKMDLLVTEYYNNGYSEKDVKTYLARISKFSFADEKYNECIKQVNNKDASDKDYAEGVQFFNEGKIEEAVEAFKKVSEKDSQRYPLAQDALLRCKSEWGTAKLSDAQKMIDAYNKEGARALLEELIELFGEYEEAEQMILTLEPELEG